ADTTTNPVAEDSPGLVSMSNYCLQTACRRMRNRCNVPRCTSFTGQHSGFQVDDILGVGRWAAIACVAYAVIRHGWNVPRSYLFIINASMLALYYLPVTILDIDLDSEHKKVILLGQL